MTTLFIACETTGAWQWRLPDNDPAQPHVLRVAAIARTDDGVGIDEFCTLIRPEADWHFEDGAVNAHGITAAIASDRGQLADDVRAQLHMLMETAQVVVGFGLDFQLRTLGRLFDGAPPTIPAGQFCCMKNARDVVKKPRMQPGGGYAFPTFAETYRHIAGAELPTSDDPIEGGLLKVRAVRAIYDDLMRGKS